MRGEHFHRIAAHTEGAAHEILVVAFVMQGHKIGEQAALFNALAAFELEGHGGIGFDISDAIDAGDGGDHDHIITFQKRARGGMAHAVDLLVDGAFLLDEGIRTRHIGFRLIIVVIGNEIFHRIVGKEALELAIKLGGQRLVGREDEGGALGGLDYLCHGEGFAGTGDAKQHLIALDGVHACHEFGDGGGLVASRGIFGDDLERHPAFRFFGPWRAVRREMRQMAGHVRPQ